MANKTIDQLTTASALASDDYMPVETQGGTKKATADLVSNSAQIADNFSTSATYAVDDLVFYQRALYRCTTAVTTAGAWTGSTNWTATTVEAELAAKAKTADLGTAATKNSATSITNASNTVATPSAVYDYTVPVIITADGTTPPSDTRSLWVFPSS